MGRRKIKAAGAAGAAVLTLASFALAAVISWNFARSEQQGQLDRDALRGLAHVQRVYVEAVDALRQIEASGEPACSPAHIQQMLQLTESSLSIVNVGYGSGELVECNAWGRLTYPLRRTRSAFVGPDGVGIVANWRPISFRTDRAMLVLRLGRYSVLVDQRTLFNDWGGAGMSELAAITMQDGTRLVPSFVPSVAAVPAEDEVTTSIKSAGGWTVKVSQPRLLFIDYLHSQWTLLLPLLIALALLFGLLAALWARWRLSLAGELAVAVRKRTLTAHYQPIIELATGRCVGAEALARWQRPDGRYVPPDVFVPLAEAAGLIGIVTDQILAAVMPDLGDWLRRDPGAHVGINLSAADVSSGRILPTLAAALLGSGIRADQIWLEATERGIIDMEGARSTLAELHRRRHKTAIDDFGTGYAGLSYLQQLPVDVLKIDRPFVEVIGTEAATRNVTDHIIGMAHGLHLSVIAEGVETEDQADYLRSMGVAYAQGWLYARALPVKAFLAYWAANRLSPARVAGDQAMPLSYTFDPGL